MREAVFGLNVYDNLTNLGTRRLPPVRTEPWSEIGIATNFAPTSPSAQVTVVVKVLST